MRGPSARTNLAVPASSFVGRERDLVALTALFEQARLVTLLGPGGMGKTRLALRYAEERLARSGRRGAGEVWIVELSASRTTSEFSAATAAVLGIELAGLPSDLAMADAIGRGLAARGRTLLVLDNFEQLIASAPIVDLWLASAPSLRILVTSRIVLGSAAEVVQVVDPLTQGDATELFLGRARLVRPAADRPSVDEAEERLLATEIVETIDRMPLAIELAASRTRVLSTVELRARLQSPLGVLSGGRERHASVRGAVLDSVALLPDASRRFFGLLSTMSNGFTLEAAEAMLEELAPLLAMPRGAMLDGLDTLVRTSLLRAFVERGAPTRYAYFETIRDVAEELREQDPARQAFLAAHARAYARLGPQLGEGVAAALDNLVSAHATAVRLAREERDASRALDAFALAGTLEPLLSARGLSRSREALWTGVLDAMEAADVRADGARTEAHLARGLARRELGETPSARQDFEAALQLSTRVGQAGLAAVALTRLGGLLDLAGETGAARARFAEALALLESTEPGDVRMRREAEAYLRLGHAHRREGALEHSRVAVAQSVQRYRLLGEEADLAAALYELSVIEMFAGRTQEAFAGFDEGLERARRSGARLMEGAHTTARGCLLQDVGELDHALAHHAEAARIFRELGSRYREASALYYLASTYLERGQPDEALAVLRQARARGADVGAFRYDALIAGGMALALAALGEDEEAEEALARAEAALLRVPDEPSLHATLAAHRGSLDAYAGRQSVAEAVRLIEPRILAAPSDDTRFAFRFLKGVGRTSRAFPSLEVWGTGEAFRVPGAERVALPARSPLRRILDQLVTLRIESPGDALSIEGVIAAGWPGEKMGADAALNRAYVALATLRRRGLRDVLVSTGGGYALSRAVVVRRLDSESVR